MEDFERQLRNALARKEPPAWFEAKVLAAASTKRSKPGFLRLAVAAGAAIAITAAIWTDHQAVVNDRAAGEAAKARLQLALKITVTELSKIQQTVRTSEE
jgi:ferric-dicitrate binding protein FerR (iron transport regulator)